MRRVRRAARRQSPASVSNSMLQRSCHKALVSSGYPLEKPARSLLESRFGHNFSNVRVHTDARAAESADAVNAMAYTVGHDIVFGNGNYSPATAAGQRLIAHELTHVLQQEHAGVTAPRVTEAPAVLQRQPKPGVLEKAPPKEPEKKTYPVENCPFPSDFADANAAGYHMNCIADAAFEKALTCNLTDQHFVLINAAREVARKRVERAERRMHWLGGPEYAQKLAGYIFKDSPPDAKTIKDTLAKVVKIISGKSMQFRGATCADPLCESEGQHAAAFESGPTEPVAFCPRAFLPSFLPDMSVTIIHEAVHLAGIDIDPDITERYCISKSCLEKCQDSTSADAWSHFIDCLGGPLIKPKPDKPAFTPRTDFKDKTVGTIEKEFGR